MQIYNYEGEFVPVDVIYHVIIGYGTLGILVKYIRDIDVDKAILFHDLILTKQEYNYVHGIVEQESEEDSFLCNFDPVKLQECIDFFETVLIPSLEQLSGNLLDNYGGEEEFIENFRDLNNDIPNLNFRIWGGDEFNDYPEDLIGIYIYPLMRIFSKAIITNQRYKIISN
jgi:hypothetical protein